LYNIQMLLVYDWNRKQRTLSSVKGQSMRQRGRGEAMVSTISRGGGEEPSINLLLPSPHSPQHNRLRRSLSPQPRSIYLNVIRVNSLYRSFY